MLGSITPLGERGRGRRWWRSVMALMLGGLVGGAATGALAGLLGETAGEVAPEWVSSTHALVVLAGGLMVAAGLDLSGRIPTIRRQVNEDWLYSYRDWVYGLGFGAQLGSGATTIVTTAAVYVTFLAAALTGSVAIGALIGGTFGFVRNATVLLTARVDTPARVAELDGLVERWRSPGKHATVTLLLSLAIVTTAMAAA